MYVDFYPIQATTLNCSHSYCSQCIEQWMRVRKICPSCRAQITSRTRSTVLDSYIDTVVEHLSDDMKTRRLEIIQERKGKFFYNKLHPVDPEQ